MAGSRSRLLNISALVLEMTAITILGALAGRWLDGRLGTGQLLQMFGLLLSFALGMARLILSATRLNPPDDQPPS